MLNPGDKAPDFTGRDHEGKTCASHFVMSL